jgi:DNA-binding response OmpR family regulator
MSLGTASSAPFTFVLDEATRILAVDDDPIQLEFASAYLSTPTASVDTAESAPVVVITSFDDIVSIDIAYEAGASSFVTKPVNWRLLSYHLRFVLRAHRL